MAHRSQCSSAGDNPLDPNYLPPHYREEYRMAIDALVEADLEGYYGFLQEADVVDFLSISEIDYIKGRLQAPHQTPQTERRNMAEDVDGSSDTYWPLHSDHDAPSLDLGWPQQLRFVGPTEVTTLVNPSDPEMPSIKEQVRRMIKNAQQVIAVVMDMFTDVDIFADILDAAARGVAVYVLLDELNAQHFVAMVNNCRVNLDEMKFMRVRTVSGSTYLCRTGKTFKGQMMDRFILVDCRAVLSGNYSFMWSFEKIHRCLAHLFLGQLVATFDEEFRILFAHSEPLVVENVLANMPQYSSEPESYYSTEKAHMFNRQYPNVGMGWAERTADVHMNVGHKMLPFRSESIHSAAEANPSLQRHMNMHAAQQYTGDHQFMDHGRQMKGPNEMVGFKRHSYGNIPDFEYMPPQNPPTMRGNQYMEDVMPHGSQFAREPRIYQGPGLQSGYEIYGRFRGQGHNTDQFPGYGYPHEGDEAEPTGGYDHVQRYLQSHSAMEEGHVPRNLLSPVQSSLKRHSMGHSYTCQTSPKQPNMPEQKSFFNANRKPQDVSQKQGLRDWRISSYLCAYDDAELDLAELEGSNICDEVPCFTKEAPCVAVRPEIRRGHRDFNRIPSPREHPTFVQLQNDSTVPESSGNHLTDLPKIHIKTTPTSTSESSCTTEGDKTEETENREPKETNRISEEFLKRKPSRPVQRGSRLRHSLIFSSNLELNTPEEMKDTPEEKEGDEASKLSARVSHILDKRRTGSPFQPFQWSNFVKSATFDNSATESAQPEEEQNKAGDNSDSEKDKTSQNPRKCSLQEKDPPQTQVPEGNSQRTECPSNVLQKSSSFIDMNDPDCRLRYFKELAAKRKLAAAKSSQANPVKATQKFALPEKPSNNDSDKTAEPVFKTPETPLKSKNTTTTEPKIKAGDTKFEESSKNILHRATDAEKIRIKKKLAEESGSTLKMFQDTDPALKPIEVATVSTAKNQTTPILNISSQKPFHTLSDVANSSKNQVGSVAFNTASILSSTTLYHIPNETYPSHTIQTQSVPPVNLPETQSLNATPNEGCISSNDSQILAQSLPKMFSTCSDSVSIDSTPNLAIVDTCVPSKPNHIDTGLSPACSTASFSQCSFKSNVDSSQSLNDTDCSKNTNAVWTESCAAESSQHPSATEENPSQHHTSIESESSKQPTPTGNRHSQKSISANSSQQPTALREDSFQYPTVTESKTSQNFTITTEADSFQQPTESESSKIFTAITITSSQQTTKTSEDSSQSHTKAGTDISQHSTSVKSETSIKPTVTGTQSLIQPNASGVASLKHPNATETGSSQNTTSTVTYSSQQNTSIEIQKPTAVKTDKDIAKQSTALVVDAIQQLMAPEEDTHQHHIATENEPFKQTPVLGTGSLQEPTATVTGFSQQSTEAVTDFPQQPTATVKDSSQKSSATDMDLSQKSTVTVTSSSLKLTATITNSSQQPTPKVADSSQHPSTGEVRTSQETGNSGQSTAKITDSSLKSTATDFFQQPTPTEPHSLQQSAATEVDSSQQSTAKKTDSALQSTATDGDLSKKSIDCFQQPVLNETGSSQQPAARETDSSQQITPTEADCSHRPTPTVKGSPQQPTPTGVDSSRQPATTETNFTPLKAIDSSQQPTPSGTDASLKPSATAIASSQQPTTTGTDFSQQPTPSGTDASLKPSATAIDSCQQPAPTGTDSSQQPTTTHTDSSQQPTPSGTDTSLKPSATAIGSSQQPTTTDTDSSQQPTPSGTDASLKPSATAIGSSQQPTTTDTDSSQQPTPSGTDASLKPSATAIDSCQQPAPTGTDSSQQPTTTDTDSSQQPTPSGTDASLKPSATAIDSCQQPTPSGTNASLKPSATAIASSQQPTTTGTDFSQQPTPSGTNASLKPPATATDSCQQPAPTGTDSSQQPTTTGTDFSQQPTPSGTNASLKPPATATDSCQQPAPTGTDSSQQPTTTDTDSSQQPTTTDTDSSQQPTPSGTDASLKPSATAIASSQQPTTTSTDFSQQPTPSGTDASLKPSATATDSCQQPAPTGTDSSQQPTTIAIASSQQPTTTSTDFSQQPTPSGTDASLKPSATAIASSQQPTTTGTDFSQQPTPSGTNASLKPPATAIASSQQPTPSGTDASLKPSATAIASSQQPTTTGTDFSQQPTPSGTDASLKPSATATDSCQQPAPTGTDSSQQPTTTETGISQQLTATETESHKKSASEATDSYQRPVAKETDSNKQLDVEKHASSHNLTKTGVEISKLFTETEKESLQYITATNSDCVNEKKDTNVSEDFNKVTSIPHVNITHTGNIISQNTVGHSHSDTVTPCDSQVELNRTQAQAKPCVTTMIKNNSALTSLHSVELSSAQPQGSEEPSPSFQEITQLQTNIANSMESSCLNDPIPEKTDGYQKNETITEQPQTHKTSAIAEGPEIFLIDVSKAIVPNEVDKTNLTPQVENSPTILAEISANSSLTAASNLENPPGVAENSTIMSTHQSSTANVISCSNLRDDTKVLLEQISAKNQNRSTQSKQTLAAACEAKGGEISSADKLFSNYSGRPWSSKATPEEREILLQKMEKMRKERKVYSRFEAS